MRALVVYESMWGNTRQVAEAIGEGLGGARELEVREAAATQLDDVGLLVVGGPTHAFSMSRPSTRHDAVERGAPAGSARGIREWLDELPAVLPMPVATFDTKVTTVRHLPGSAKGAARRVHRNHHGTVVDRRSFYVVDTGGPLAPGEVERAARWGAELAATVGARH
jgi:hypothetical protein